jgi:hypothetical protein
MKVRVSKVFADFINKTAKEMDFSAHADVVTIGERTYSFFTGSSVYDADNDGDYNWAEDAYRVIKVSYPENYYVAPRYLSTRRIVDEFKSRGVKDLNGLKEMIKDLLEV